MTWQFKTSWQTQLKILWIGQVLLLAMLAMSMPYWPLYITQLGNYSSQEVRFWSAAIYIAPFVTSIFSSPYWGKVGDKYGYKPMIIRACLGLFITQILILLFSNVFLIFLIRLLQGVLAGFIASAQAWALSISPQDEYGATIGKLQSATAIGNLLGPLMGGVIATYAGYKAIFSISSVICAVVTMLFFYFLQNTRKINETAFNEITAINKNFLHKVKQSIISILFIIVIIQLARQIITPVFALFVTEQLGGNDIIVGLLYAAPGLMIFVTAPYWGKFFDRLLIKNYSVHYIVAGLLFTSAIFQVLHVYADTTIEIFILRFLWGICLGALLPILLRLLINNTDNNEKGMFLGLGNSATKLGNLLGILLGALVEVNFGYASSFLMMAGLYVIAAGIVILLHFKAKNQLIIQSDQFQEYPRKDV